MLKFKDIINKFILSIKNIINKFKLKNLVPHIPLIFCIILMFVFIIISNGYASDVNNGSESLSGDTNSQKQINVKEKEINYLKQNCLNTEIQIVDNSADNPPANGYYNKIAISGLADTAIQDKINQTISAKYDELYQRTIPEYRGMDSVIDFSSAKQSQCITTSVMGNFNDILSILIKKDVTQSNVFYSDCETLNFDLKTGELIKLKDLFEKDNCEFLNQYIGNNIRLLGNYYKGGKIYDAKNEYLMISAFKGISDEQKFYLCENKLVVLIDYTNQEFYKTNYKPYEIGIEYDKIGNYIDLEKYIAPVQTNEDGTTSGIYVNSNLTYMLIYDNDKIKDVEAYEPEGRDNLKFTVNCSYPEDFPDVLKDKAANLCLIDDNVINELKNAADSNSSAHYRYINNVRAYKIGAYYNITRSSSSFKVNNQSEDSASYVFDKEGNQLYIDKMFKSDFDYESVIKSCIVEKLKNDFPDGNYGGKSIDEIYCGISFGLDSYGMQIKTQPIKFNSGQDGLEYESSVSVFIPYEKFGCDQMTIFN